MQCLWFQFLIGWLQTQERVTLMAMKSMSFNSSQVGYKLNTSVKAPKIGNTVSIPHRLATNDLWYTLAEQDSRCFNSSQVGYKLKEIIVDDEFSKSFNSLQVGYKLSLINAHAASGSSFNSLQVGYKPFSFSCVLLLYFVSIPYRLATNGGLICTTVIFKLEFQFLIGWLQTCIVEVVQTANPRVSIPYRLATNLQEVKMAKEKKSRFQFLIGWLQTFQSLYACCAVLMFQFLIGWLQTVYKRG